MLGVTAGSIEREHQAMLSELDSGGAATSTVGLFFDFKSCRASVTISITCCYSCDHTVLRVLIVSHNSHMCARHMRGS